MLEECLRLDIVDANEDRPPWLGLGEKRGANENEDQNKDSMSETHGSPEKLWVKRNRQARAGGWNGSLCQDIHDVPDSQQSAGFRIAMGPVVLGGSDCGIAKSWPTCTLRRLKAEQRPLLIAVD